MSGILERSLAVLEYLARHADGAPMATIADDLAVPRSAMHRLLGDLCEARYVRQTRRHGEYALTLKLPALGLSFLGRSGIVDIAQPTPGGARVVPRRQRGLPRSNG